MLIEELEQIKSKDIDKDTKLKIVSKDEIKEVLGRSPDFSDTLMMRSYFEYKIAVGITAPVHYASSALPQSPSMKLPNSPKIAPVHYPKL